MPRGGSRPGAGRPPTGARDRVLGFRVKSAELEQAEAVRRKGETMSAMARTAWLNEVARREALASEVKRRERVTRQGGSDG